MPRLHYSLPLVDTFGDAASSRVNFPIRNAARCRVSKQSHPLWRRGFQPRQLPHSQRGRMPRLQAIDPLWRRGFQPRQPPLSQCGEKTSRDLPRCREIDNKRTEFRYRAVFAASALAGSQQLEVASLGGPLELYANRPPLFLRKLAFSHRRAKRPWIVSDVDLVAFDPSVGHLDL